MMYRVYQLVNPKLDRYAAPYLYEAVTDFLKRERIKAIALDFENVTFMDSAGLGGLVRVLKAVRLAEAELYLCSLSEQVETLLKLSALDQVFKFCKLEEFPAIAQQAAGEVGTEYRAG